jgi:energy-coupling factor transporter ATP-binding protein EcfA2
VKRQYGMSMPLSDRGRGRLRAPMLKLKRLKINKFRHVVPTELIFDDRYNVPLGINGSGKTTLLKLISACLRSDFSEYKAEELDVEYELATEQIGCCIVVANALSPFERASDYVVDDDPALRVSLERGRWWSTARIRVRVSNGSEATILVGQPVMGADDESTSAPTLEVRTRAPTEGFSLYSVLRSAFLSLERGRTERNFRGGLDALPGLHDPSFCYRFDESLATFGAITGQAATTKSEREFEPYLALDFVLEEGSFGHQGWTGSAHAFVPAALADDVANAAEVLTREQGLGAGFRVAVEPTFVKRFAEAASFRQGEMVVEALEGEIEAQRQHEVMRVRFGRFRFRFRTRGEGFVAHELLSYGQKRLLSFLYYVACNDACVVADELVNGLHHAWIEVCLDAIGERQAFLTSQNPLLLDFLPPTSPEEAERRFIRCVLEELEGRDVMVWRNLTREEAAEFCEEYAVGVQQVSELLRVQGLW